MDRLHQLFSDIKSLFSQAKGEKRGRPREKTRGHPFPDAVAIQTALIVLLAIARDMKMSLIQKLS